MDSSKPWRSLVYGGVASSLAESCTIPLDVLKVRMQLQGQVGMARQYRNMFDAAAQILRYEGPLAFTKGLKPAVLRQLTYGSLRFGLYAEYKKVLGVTKDGSGIWGKCLAGSLSGATAAFFCTPTDLIKVRMQASARGASGSVVRTAWSIVRRQGFLGLYTGAVPTASRAAVVAVAEIGSYDEIKGAILRRQILEDGVPLHIGTAAVSGFLATIASSPFDVAKSRLMSQPYGPGGVGLRYRGAADVFTKSLANEGPGFVFRGFWPNYLNKGPTVVLLFVLYEQVQRIGDAWLDGPEWTAGVGRYAPRHARGVQAQI